MFIIFFSLAKKIGQNKLFHINDYDKLSITLETLKHDIAYLDTIFPYKLIINQEIKEKNITKFIEELDITNIIFDDTSLTDLKIFNHEIIYRFDEEIRRYNYDILEYHEIIKKRLERLKNIVSFCSFFNKYSKLWHIVSNPRSIITMKLFGEMMPSITYFINKYHKK